MESRPPYITRNPSRPFAEWGAYTVAADKHRSSRQGFGHISEARIGGGGFLKVVDVDGSTTYYAPSQITSIVPDTEQEIRRLALGNPVTLNRLPGQEEQT